MTQSPEEAAREFAEEWVMSNRTRIDNNGNRVELINDLAALITAREKAAPAWQPISDAPEWLVKMAKMNPPRLAELVVNNFNFEGNRFASVYWDQDKCEPTFFMLREFPPAAILKGDDK